MSEMMFDGQREGEEVQFIFRRNVWMTRRGLMFFIIMFGLGLAPLLIWRENPGMIWVFLICVMIGVLGLLYAYMLWYFSIYIVTNQRIRQVTQKGLFKKTVVDLGLDKIQSIAFNVPGVMGGIFNYGTILIRTSVGDLTISMVSDAEKIYNKLQNVSEGEK